MEYLRDNQIFIDENTLSVNITRLRTKLKEMGLNMYALLYKLGQSRKDAKRVLNRLLGIYYLMPVILPLMISVSFFDSVK